MRSTQPAQMHLGAFLQDAGHHIAAWRHPDAPAGAGMNFDHFRYLAQRAEAAKFDMIFLGDQMTFQYEEDETLGRTSRTVNFEPLTLLSALAGSTSRIGLIATASTSYNEPFNVARKYASLDHISHGRAGWNVVTSWTGGEARNFNRSEVMEHGLRYRRAQEFVEVVKGLWDSWDSDALLDDRQQGYFFDPARLHVLDHQGEFFQVRGPLTISRSPQGHPVMVQAGSSADGQTLAARHAEVIFTAQRHLAEAQSFYRTVKEQLVSAGRTPESLKIMPGVFPVVGESAAHAREKFEQLQALVNPEIGWAVLARHLGGVDLSRYSPDDPVPDLPLTQGNQSRQALLLAFARRENLTIRELYWHVTGTRGHWCVFGTASEIADVLESWFTQGAADGFNIMAPWLPGGLDEFIDEVVPVLQRRGLFRTDYQGTTLRDHLGLAPPRSRYANREAR
ncbi:Xenobiotic compound monooxygenase A subunit (plasmid) [Sodalis praecaptivus]|uniref:Xenobiotic compound monooxygenase A subunit n=1 Tax=Sodalis praecaptivus TaxID=1239307 RepID=W0HZK3_9GAMM|nr:LLM class flavin-dependent oxidoreductase [Sodalis praecaptivus]AHF79204.1 Xenobiotic compound monooxygenase A subunit [Sodalis praecaptivus]